MFHWTCASSVVVQNETAWVPLGVLNSPFGGSANIDSSVPPSLFDSSPNDTPPGIVGNVSNGSIGGGLWRVNITVSRLTSGLAWGPGLDSRCPQPYLATLETVYPSHLYTGDFFGWAWGPQFGPNSTTDQGEPHQFNLSLVPGDSTVYFYNGFVAANHASVSTCGAGPQTLVTESASLTVFVPFRVGGVNLTQPVTLPIAERFSYSFPANVGIWQIDNLSAPGSPGGGWAFSYSPCP